MVTVLRDQVVLPIHSYLFICRFCRSKAPDIHPVDSSVVDSPILGFVVICHCNTLNLPFVVCLTCRVVSSHSRNQNRRNLYKQWHKKHFASPGHHHLLLFASTVDDTLNDIDDSSVDGVPYSVEDDPSSAFLYFPCRLCWILLWRVVSFSMKE
jgi:hypothetical protein